MKPFEKIVSRKDPAQADSAMSVDRRSLSAALRGGWWAAVP